MHSSGENKILSENCNKEGWQIPFRILFDHFTGGGGEIIKTNSTYIYSPISSLIFCAGKKQIKKEIT